MSNTKAIIVLTDRAPVQIDFKNWKTISEAIYNQSEPPPYEVGIRVLEHEDGRRLVYGWNDQDSPILIAGYVLMAGDSEGYTTVDKIRTVGRIIEATNLAEKCIMQLPPINLD